MQERRSPARNGRALGAAVFISAAGFLVLPGVSAQVAEPALAGVPARAPAASVADRLVFEAPHARFDDRYQFETVTRSFAFTHRGSAPLRILRAIALDGTGRISFHPEILTPGAIGRAEVVQPLADRLGEVAFRYALLTDDPGSPRYRFTLSGFVQSAFDPERPRLEFGTLDRTQGGRAEVAVASREVERLEILGVEESPPFLKISWDPLRPGEPSIRVVATLTPGAPQGLLTGRVVLRTNVSHQPTLALQYTAQVFGDVVPEANPVQFGAIRVGESITRTVRLRSRTGRPFEAAAAGPDSSWAATVRSCDGAPGPSTCQELELRLTALAPGPLVATIEIEIAGESVRLPLICNGLVVQPGTNIRQVEIPSPAPLELTPGEAP
jgi:hypothetical protein